ncbi:MAG: TIGR02444 family protein [Pseudolabrys sp.]
MDSPFWDFSVAVYGAHGVQDECLTLQDQFGIDVNLLLFCAFAGAVHGAALTADDIVSARREVDAWHKDIVGRLRAVRRRLKTIELHDAIAKAVADLRNQVKAAELESERIEQVMLQQWAAARLATRPRGNKGDIVLANLQALLAGYSLGPDRPAAADIMKNLIAAALTR